MRFCLFLRLSRRLRAAFLQLPIYHRYAILKKKDYFVIIVPAISWASLVVAFVPSKRSAAQRGGRLDKPCVHFTLAFPDADLASLIPSGGDLCR